MRILIKLRTVVVTLAAMIALGGLLATSAQAGKRVALVIGNSAYKHTPVLANPKHDAADMVKTLRQLGFQVVDGRDLNKTDMDRTILRFAEKLTGATLGAFFYAGHGLQVNGINYLVPIDAKLSTAYALEFEMVRLDKVQRVMEGATQTNIIFLDACRDNPLARNLARALGARSISIGRGLAHVEAGLGTLISYATQPDAVAFDGKGRNSPYTAALKRHLLTPGEDLTSVLIAVRNDVLTATNRRQVPWDQHALRAKLYLRGRPGPARIPGAGDLARQARITQQIARARSIQELDILLRLEPSRAAEIEARKLALLQEARHRDPLATLVPGSGRSARDRLADGSVCPYCPEMVVVPAGSFQMGSNKGDEDEKPVHTVKIGRPFAVGKFEVTFAEWDACVVAGGCAHKPDDQGWGRGRRPVISVSWDDVQHYVAWLSKKTGKAYRLLSEAEWEYAARARTTTRYAFGDRISKRQAQFSERQILSAGNTLKVGSFQPNAFGLYDMHGNAWEWVTDCWNKSYSGAPTDGAAWTKGNCSLRVLRGGAWSIDARSLRSADRDKSWMADSRGRDIGFRIARTLTP